MDKVICPECGYDNTDDLMDPEILEDAKSDGIHVCLCCHEIDVSDII